MATTRTALVAEPNITPLIDVLLVLLIIFMLVAPAVPRGVEAALPPSATGGRAAPEALVVEVDPTGLRLNAATFGSVDALETHLRETLAARRDRTVFVKASGPLAYRSVVAVMDAARSAGAERIGLVAPTMPACATGPCGASSRPSPGGTGS